MWKISEKAFDALKKDVGVKVKPKKCNLFQKEARDLGRIMSAEGHRADGCTSSSKTEDSWTRWRFAETSWNHWLLPQNVKGFFRWAKPVFEQTTNRRSTLHSQNMWKIIRKKFLQCFKQYGVKVKPKKCNLFQKEARYLVYLQKGTELMKSGCTSRFKTEDS